MSVAVVAVISAKPGQGKHVIEALRETSPLVPLERGCELYAAHLEQGADSVAMVERWTTMADFQSHVGAPALVAFNATISDAVYPYITFVSSVLAANVDGYDPCALGGTLTESSVENIAARVPCGAVNNQLLTDDVERVIVDRVATWVPDYVADSGELIQVAAEFGNQNVFHAPGWITVVGLTVERILREARGERTTAGHAALAIADERLESTSSSSHD